MPRVLSERPVALIAGPSGVGRTLVARALVGADAVEIDVRRFEVVCVARMRTRRWPDALSARGNMVLDIAGYLGDCRLGLLVELLKQRAAAGLRTAVCLDDDLGVALLALLPDAQAAMVALHFPSGKKARLRYAQTVCAELELPVSAALFTAGVTPWSYEAVREVLAVFRGSQLPVNDNGVAPEVLGQVGGAPAAKLTGRAGRSA